MLAWYLRMLERHPLVTQAIATGFLAGTGDVLAQQVIERRGRQHDVVRTARFFTFGVTFIGPALRGWYVTLDKLVKLQNPALAAGAKMALDQFAFTPVFLGGFFTGLGLLEGKSMARIKRQLDNEYFNVLLNNWKVWPAVQICNFYLVPLQHRVIVVNTVSVAWNTYLTWTFHKAGAEGSSSPTDATESSAA